LIQLVCFMKNNMRSNQGSKWIKGLNAKLGIKEAARLVLGHRLLPVSYWLDRVLESPHPGEEDIHQLRINSRRAMAALRVFDSCIPEKKIKKELKNVLRSTRDIRDWDVFRINLENYLKTSDSSSSFSTDCLKIMAIGQRIASQKEMLNLQCIKNKLPKLISKTSANLKLPEKLENHNLYSICNKALKKALTDFNSNLEGDLDTFSNLHKLRISGKRCRYTLEIFGEVIPSELMSRIYPMLERLQEILGSTNDYYFILNLFNKLIEHVQSCWDLWRKFHPGFDLLREINHKNLTSSLNEFSSWKTKWIEMRFTFPE